MDLLKIGDRRFKCFPAKGKKKSKETRVFPNPQMKL